jgi:8-oxo-dGTP pyrophosphatase MutT (NUDIX family)
MMQMYKVFISEKEVSFLSNKHFKQNDFNVFNAADISGDRDAFLKSKLNLFNTVKILCEEPFLEMMNFFNNHKLINAGGGLVLNDDKFLWIYRNNMWDLPKGKQELSEEVTVTAIREVQEECGIDKGLTIDRFLVSTFHTYSIKGISVLKRTDWFLMSYKGEVSKLTPQLEEGITNVKWLNKLESINRANKSYKSINQVWKSYYDEL